MVPVGTVRFFSFGALPEEVEGVDLRRMNWARGKSERKVSETAERGRDERAKGDEAEGNVHGQE